MFQFTAYPLVRLWIHLTIPEVCSGRFPHSEISGSMAICASPKLFAAYHVLHRLLVPRHSPCALVRLTIAFALSWNKAVKWNEFWNIFFKSFKNVELYFSRLTLFHFFIQFSRYRFIFWKGFVLSVEIARFELATPCLQGRCSPNWAKPP